MTTLWEVLSRFGKLFIWWTIISPWEGGIRVRLGRGVVSLGPGIHFCIPYLDAVFKQTLRMRITGLQRQTLSTSDGKTVTLCATVGYSVADVWKLYNTLHHADETIRNIIAGHIAKIVQAKALDDCSPDVIERETNERLDLRQFGLDKACVRLVDFAAVRTYRLLQDQRWHTGDDLDTSKIANR